jgi:hypothetical protein
MELGVAGLSHGAVLIGPFEGSRWRGGCGEYLWDLNGRSRLGRSLFLGSASFRTCDAVRRDVIKGLFGGEGGAAFELFCARASIHYRRFRPPGCF